MTIYFIAFFVHLSPYFHSFHTRSSLDDPHLIDHLSPNYCLAVKPSPITGCSPFFPSTPVPKPSIHPAYQPDLGILPTVFGSDPSNTLPDYTPHESIIPLAPHSQSESPLPARHYERHESIIPMSPKPQPAVRAHDVKEIGALQVDKECLAGDFDTIGNSFGSYILQHVCHAILA